MRNQVDLLVWNSKYILQNLGRVFAHNNETLGPCDDLLHSKLLVDIRLTENSMESRDHGHVKVL
jgi:hypothetical protein